MAQWLSKTSLLFLFVALTGSRGFSQQTSPTPVYKDYKDAEQFEKFRKRSIVVGAWQINTLKEKGALVVKLKTNKLLIDQLMKQGDTTLAIEKQLEQFAINKNTMLAFKENFNFCKVYFINSTSNDSLLAGTRRGIFLDTALNVDPEISMAESFYILAERDYIYTSSIGFIPEDSARIKKETGNPIKLMAFVLKNKYGHQLKDPFPFSVKEKSYSATWYEFPIRYTLNPSGKISAFYTVNRTYLLDLKTAPAPKRINKQENGMIFTSVKLRKEFTYEKLSLAVTELNEDLLRFFNSYPMPDMNRVKVNVKPFLY